MSRIGVPQFEFPELCSIFGVSNVRRASVLHFSVLKFLEAELQHVSRASEVYEDIVSRSLF